MPFSVFVVEIRRHYLYAKKSAEFEFCATIRYKLLTTKSSARKRKNNRKRIIERKFAYHIKKLFSTYLELIG